MLSPRERSSTPVFPKRQRRRSAGRRIAQVDDLHISPLREDGVTYGTPTWIWSVAVEGALYVRAYNGQLQVRGPALRILERQNQRKVNRRRNKT
ncbi:MAG: DUF2255 family protein [Verrucomicrobia bacterium]|nr:DUF2255 family protein [Verrucomicrobiota bacterium]